MDDQKRCRATNRSGKRCGRYAIPGGRVCTTHGGRAVQVKAAADRRLAQADAERIVSQVVTARGPLSLADVYTELQKTAGLAVAWRDMLEEKVTALTEWRYEAKGAGTEQLRSEIALFERSLDRVGKLLEVIARLDLDTRVAALNAAQGAAVAEVIRRTVDRVPSLTPAQRSEFLAVIPEELRRLQEARL